MKIINMFRLIGKAALAVLVIHYWAAPLRAGVAVSIGQNFTGSTDSFNTAPNPSGAASADYFTEFNCDTFAVYTKADGTLVRALDWSDFWSQAGVPLPATYQHGDSRIIYDPSVQRWFVAENLGDPTAQPVVRAPALAVSAIADPTGAWHGAIIRSAAGWTNGSFQFSLGLDAQGVYLASPFKTVTTGSVLLSLPKADLLLIPPVVTNLTFFGTLAGADYGVRPVPAIGLDGSAGGDVVATAGQGISGQNNSTLVVFAVRKSGDPGAALSNPNALEVSTYFSPPNALQPDGTSNLVDWDATFTANVYCVGGVLFAAGPTQVGPRVAIRWYRISATNDTLLESGTISDPSLDLFYPSIAANSNGTVVIAFNGSGTNRFPSCYAAVGQTVDGVTTFGNLLLLKSGVATCQNPDSSGDNLWGRYSTTCVDPTNSAIFWTINAYAAGPTTWATQITQLLTSPSPQLSLANTGANLLLSWPITAVPFQHESAPALPGDASWAPVTQLPATNGTTVSVLVPATDANAFFRLKQQ